MKNKNRISNNHNLDTSCESYKFNNQRNNKIKINNKIKNKNNDNHNIKNIYRTNNNNYNNDHKTNYINKNYLRVKTNNMNSNISKEKLIKQRYSPLRKVCKTPDRNIKYNLGLTPNKNNISLLKLNNHRDSHLNEFNNNKKGIKLFLCRNNQRNSNLSNERKRVSTPDRMKIRNLNMDKKINKESDSTNYFFQRKLLTNESKSFHDSNYSILKNNKDEYKIFNDTSSSFYRKKCFLRNKTPDRLSKNFKNNKYKYKFGNKFSKDIKIRNSNNSSNLKFSKSFCSKIEKKYVLDDFKKSNEKNYLISNSQINSRKRRLTNDNQPKIFLRSKSINSNSITKKFFKSEINNSRYLKYINNKNNNNSFEWSSNSKKKSNNHAFHNANDSKKTNMANFSTNYEKYINRKELTFSQKKANKDLGKLYMPQNNYNNNSTSIFEINQYKMNKEQINKKNYKYIGINNFVTKSSTNTYDEFNSSNSNISRNNKNLDSIEEIHFNFVNIVQNSRNLTKIENKLGEKILNNNQNSSVIFLEERDIE